MEPIPRHRGRVWFAQEPMSVLPQDAGRFTNQSFPAIGRQDNGKGPTKVCRA
jgi:hypothetical protein